MPTWKIKTPSKKQAEAHADKGLVYDPSGWELVTGTDQDAPVWRKKATIEDIAALNSTGRNMGPEGGISSDSGDIFGMHYDPNTGYIHAYDPPKPGGQSFLGVKNWGPVAALLAVGYTAGAAYAALGAGAAGGAAGGAAAGSTAVGDMVGGATTLSGGAGAGMTGAAAVGGSAIPVVAGGTTAAAAPAVVGGASSTVPAAVSGGAAGGAAVAPAAAGGGWTAGNTLSALGLGLGVINGLTAPTGGQNVSSNTASTNLPTYMQGDAQGLWDQYINDFYGTGKTTGTYPGITTPTKSYQTRMGEDIDYVAALEKRLAGLAEGQVSDAQGRTGLFTPTNVSVNGSKIFDFVPRSNRDLAKQILTTAGLDTSLQTAHPPNEGTQAYTDFLGNLALKLNTGSNSSTSTAQVPGPSVWTNIMQGLNQGLTLADAISKYNKQNNTNYTPYDFTTPTTTGTSFYNTPGADPS